MEDIPHAIEGRVRSPRRGLAGVVGGAGTINRLPRTGFEAGAVFGLTATQLLLAIGNRRKSAASHGPTIVQERQPSTGHPDGVWCVQGGGVDINRPPPYGVSDE